MADYFPPIADQMFTLTRVVGLEKLPEHPDFGVLDADTVGSILEPAAQLAGGVLAPINHSGDREGNVLKDGVVTTAKGFKDAYKQFCEGGWNSVVFDPAHGGQGLPWLVAFALQEMWQGANLSFGLCPLLNQGAVEAIEAHAGDGIKTTYLEKMVSGTWTGTMNLTEPQAGSDLAAVRTKAVRDGDVFRIFGQKIFITYGEHDFTDNIIHLVLARIEGAPDGVKGISLFVVPKFLEDGSRNDVMCTGIEHKLGIHASPTCTMQYGDVAGDKKGAVGYLVGTENEGLKYMFTMMNNARLSVGLQGVAVAEAAYQHAMAYAKERVQGAALSKKGAGAGPIADHADVKRMLLSMGAQIDAGRALAYEAALYLDLARAGDAAAQARVDVMTPLVKSWCTDMAVDVTSTGVQIHGGMGFIEETGAAQFYRDARILPIYEGTNGIQAADLVFRKILRDQGAALTAYMKEFSDVIDALKAAKGDDARVIHDRLLETREAVERAAIHLGALAKDDSDLAAAVSVPFLNALATLAGGVMLGRATLAALNALENGEDDADMLNRKIIHARFYAEQFLPIAQAKAKSVLMGAKTITGSTY